MFLVGHPVRHLLGFRQGQQELHRVVKLRPHKKLPNANLYVVMERLNVMKIAKMEIRWKMMVALINVNSRGDMLVDRLE